MFSEELKTLRSNFLVHWTGRDLEERYTSHPFPIEVKRAEYVQRLIGTLKEGLWMNIVKIEMSRPGFESIYLRPATCFTEIKLSQIKKHTERYGCLGFGFTRQFIMDRYGVPVLYVPGYKESEGSRNLDIISPHILKLCEILNFLAGETNKNVDAFHEDPKPFLKGFMDSIDFEQFLRDYRYDRELQNPYGIFEYLTASAATVAIFIKKMSDKKCKNKFDLLDEAEWRIPYAQPHPSVNPPIRDVNSLESKINPIAKIPFNPDALKVLIFPDDETRRMASDNEFFQCWLKERKGFPIMATVDECTQF